LTVVEKTNCNKCINNWIMRTFESDKCFKYLFLSLIKNYEDRRHCFDIGRYCYVINYAPETGQSCYQLQIRNVKGYNEQVVGFDSVYNANHEYSSTEAEKW
jgi:hypothetical protein